MAQVNPSNYVHLDYYRGRSDGWYLEKATGNVVLVINGVVSATLGAAPTAGNMLVGNGTAYASVAVSGDASLSSAGALTLASPQRLQSTTVALTPTTIVGNSAGDIAHAAGVTLVPAVTGKIIVVDSVHIAYTYSTDAYGDGGTLAAIYVGGSACTGTVAAATSLGAGASNVNLLRPLSGAVLASTAVALFASGAFSNAGTAAGTASVTTYYRLVSA